jgi:hypothetical protein
VLLPHYRNGSGVPLSSPRCPSPGMAHSSWQNEQAWERLHMIPHTRDTWPPLCMMTRRRCMQGTPAITNSATCAPMQPPGRCCCHCVGFFLRVKRCVHVQGPAQQNSSCTCMTLAGLPCCLRH